MKHLIFILIAFIGSSCVKAANVYSIPDYTYNNMVTSASDYYIYCGVNQGTMTLTPSGGYAGATLVAHYGTTTPTKYVWSATFSGECDRYYIWPNGGKADISVYLTNGQTGGTMVVTCQMYSGSTLLGSASMYICVM